METKQPYKPCVNCPFLINNDYMLTEGRKAQLAEAFNRDQHFQCHKTLDYSDVDEDGEPDDRDGKFCVGSLIACDRHNGIPQMARIAARLGLLDLALIDWDDPNIIDLEDWNNYVDLSEDDEEEDEWEL